MQRQRADGKRWKCGVKCVRRRSEQARVLSASPAAGAGHYTWHHSQATPADVPLVSQRVCVFAYLHSTGRQTPTRTLCEDNGLCNDYRITPLSHPPVFVATSITVMDTVRLLSPRYDMTQCDITHMSPPRGWWAWSADQRRMCCGWFELGKLLCRTSRKANIGSNGGSWGKKEKDGGV